ncbi:tRNA (adenosine(37)-N6)-threonylcarbamoyltransferase complex ATPase subunit type 1 TsaE [Limoniibacter endophyticus]|uniref:tRNA threonylcarbamoyladenosine biosynthesis protein TsaE n=1 Tax=Limoniibacter endophyticus TaxID=1565040 RepID=A0A8J3GGT1_9HYPH|nr:tRNA (adenosine(37)-N6)-threonylcarbamoyltransferase complex ATPase subunit type 1 TsaE [Limoniibacter endophyticus]GHC74571.1 bifunctional tRNA (adenosine(37)-N6)-threonylcarbamoyltransferase complex ATPase subunit type 1 TsaE/phosphotransferase [Limoniibacter endophyticus]
MNDYSTIELHLPDDAATQRFGQDLAAALHRGDVLMLKGDLGAGKSTLARSIIRALAGDAELEVPSPTFTLVQSYQTALPAYHYDLYRLGDQDEIFELGFDEASSSGVCLVEWPQMAEAHMPADGLVISLTEADDGGRYAELAGPKEKMDRLNRAMEQRRFLENSGWRNARREYLSGDASARHYEHVFVEDRDAILVDSPALVPAGPMNSTKSYADIAHIALNCTSFFAVGEILRGGGLRVPSIYAKDLDNGFLLLENLGHDGIVDADGKPIAERYLAAADMLATMHSRAWPRTHVEAGISYELPPFDRDAIMAELDLLVDWYVPERTGGPAPSSLRAEYHALWHEALDGIEEGEKTIMLRDFHSPNILWQEASEGSDRVGLIDFQDALWGPSAYDLASLAFDARVDVPANMENAILERYLERRKDTALFEAEGFRRAYALMALQRNSKILGIFVRLNRRDGKPGYMRHLPRISGYIRRALDHPRLGSLREFYIRNRLIDNVE